MTARLALFLAAALALAGCRHREITKLDREQAANMTSEADFAVTVREWSRAEGLYAGAAKLCPDSGDIWLHLGIVRMRLNDHDGARSAYKSAASVYEQEASVEPLKSMAVIRRAYVLVILGRSDEARSMVAKAFEKHPNDLILNKFMDNKGLDKMLADPELKSISP